MSETIEWINQTYNPFPNEVSYKNHGTYAAKLKTNGTFLTVNYWTTNLILNSCVATVENKQEPNHQRSSNMVVTETQTFNLREIDPSRIKVEKMASIYEGNICDTDPNDCDEASIDLATTNQKLAIRTRTVLEFPELTGSDHLQITDKMKDSTFLYVDNLEYLPRLVAALKRGIELCGGKPSAF